MDNNWITKRGKVRETMANRPMFRCPRGGKIKIRARYVHPRSLISIATKANYEDRRDPFLSIISENQNGLIQQAEFRRDEFISRSSFDRCLSRILESRFQDKSGMLALVFILLARSPDCSYQQGSASPIRFIGERSQSFLSILVIEASICRRAVINVKINESRSAFYLAERSSRRPSFLSARRSLIMLIESRETSRDRIGNRNASFARRKVTWIGTSSIEFETSM